MNQLVIFDLDGLLVNSEPFHRKSYQKTFAEQGIIISDEEYDKDWVQNGKYTRDAVDKYGLGKDEGEKQKITEKIRNRKQEIYTVMVNNELVLMPGAQELLDDLCGKIDLVLATDSRVYSVSLILSKFNLETYFKKVFTKEIVGTNKPDPDLFLHAAYIMNVSPEKCVVIEDAQKGLIAAKKAGMKCVICPNKNNLPENASLEKLFSDADKIVHTLYELNYNILREL